MPKTTAAALLRSLASDIRRLHRDLSRAPSILLRSSVSSLIYPSFASPSSGTGRCRTLIAHALFSTTTTCPTTSHSPGAREDRSSGESGLEDWGTEWEEEEECEAQIGDGGEGGGVVLGGLSWGDRALSAAREILLQFGENLVMFAFKVSHRGYVYVRLDDLTNQYGCPNIDEIKRFNNLYKKRLDELGECGEIPSDLALEVSSPGAERLLKVPEDLARFKQMPVWVRYNNEDDSSKDIQTEGVFMLDLVDQQTGSCVWKLADVKENRAKLGKGRPLSRKHKDWRLKLQFDKIHRVKLYLNPIN